MKESSILLPCCKASIVCGELAALVGYIPGVDIRTDMKKKRVDIVTGGGVR